MCDRCHQRAVETSQTCARTASRLILLGLQEHTELQCLQQVNITMCQTDSIIINVHCIHWGEDGDKIMGMGWKWGQNSLPSHSLLSTAYTALECFVFLVDAAHHFNCLY